MKKSLGSKTMKTVVFPTVVMIVCTYDENGKPNAMNACWGGICSSSPASMAVSLRKATYSYHNIVSRKAFTLNIPSSKYIKEADYFGIASGKDTDKFAKTGLTAVKSDLVDAPYIKEFPVAVECVLTHTVELGLHTQFIGEIMDVKVDEEMLIKGDVPDTEKVDPILFSPENMNYYGIGQVLGKAFEIGKML
ncbi:MAG: flavin reductase family protein [Candidatus Auribacterota bacterium]|jgi:flavin reductase (DIM6/NTAB) family NADH-FMN oxidoreductase RutF|nr:flavin reductase family protein [Candidatus Auribacterota bacterium]